MKRAIALLAVAGLLIAAAPVKLAPADDPVALVGAAARARHGIEPLARPTDDLGMADDPADNGAPAQAPRTPVPAAPTGATPPK